ncbi:hypothetical protein NFI96_006445 [Prochilodus magdalenae]|nr:hypothetical protein NFI96_006445 [Prochilodus magdalenae]
MQHTAKMNSTNDNQLFTYEQVYKVDFDAATGSKIAVVVLLSLFFVYINCIMLFALRSKPKFRESPRYILFSHMLFNDSVLLLVTTVMYAMSLALLNVAKAVCSLLVLISSCTFQNAPLTLAVMSLERYVAICFPLRHSTIATERSTAIAIGIIWFLSSLNFVTDIIHAFITDPNHLVVITFCTREKLFDKLFRQYNLITSCTDILSHLRNSSSVAFPWDKARNKVKEQTWALQQTDSTKGCNYETQFNCRSKPVFRETPRYILFAHMLLNDSVHLAFSSMMYCLALVSFKIVTVGCAFMVFVSGTTFFNTPLNLAVMSLERYVAICFPLRHAEIATQKRTYLAVILIWCLSSINFLCDLFFRAVMDPNFFTSQVFCTKERLFIKPWQLDVSKGFDTFYFVSVSLIIIFTYIRIMITARSVTSNKESAKRAYRTVLLHVIQLCLCLTTFLYSIIESAAAMLGNSTLFLDLRYMNYLFILVLPRCLSPLIYGLRDDSLKPLFMYYFHCGKGKIRPAVSLH